MARFQAPSVRQSGLTDRNDFGLKISRVSTDANLSNIGGH